MVMKAKWVIRVPEGAKLFIKRGQKVNQGSLVLELERKKVPWWDVEEMFLNKKEKVIEFNQRWLGKKVNRNQILYKMGGIFGRKLLSPAEGICLGIDEFYNLKIETETEKKEIKSPVAALVSELGKEKVVLEFEVMEFKGMGLIEGKVWGELSGDDEIQEGKVVMMDKADRAVMTKAWVLGAAGVVAREADKVDWEGIELPILILKENDWEKLEKYKGRRVLLNSKMARLLVVLK